MTERTVRLPERVEVGDLVLRRWEQDDVDALSEVIGRNVEHLRPWMPWIANEPLARSARLALIDDWTRAWQEDGEVIFGIFHEGAPIGGTGLHRRRAPRTLEIGYWVDAAHTGHGVATATSRALATLALGVEGVDAVEIHHDRANVASGRVPEKLDFRLVGEVPKEPTAPGEVGIERVWRATTDWLASHG